MARSFNFESRGQGGDCHLRQHGRIRLTPAARTPQKKMSPGLFSAVPGSPPGYTRRARRWGRIWGEQRWVLCERPAHRAPHRWPCRRATPSRCAPTDGTRLHTEVFGPADGYPIVLAHGITCAIRVWAHQIAELANHYRVIAFDHRGHGRSEIPRRGGYSLSHLAADVDAVLEATLAPGERAVIAGHSMGGMAIAAWSDRYRHKVASRADAVALINTTTGDLLREVRLLPVPAQFSAVRVLGGRALVNIFGSFTVPPAVRRASREMISMLAVGARRRPRGRGTDLRAVQHHVAGGSRRLRQGARRRDGTSAHQPFRSDRPHAGHRQRTRSADAAGPVPADRRCRTKPGRPRRVARWSLLDAGTARRGEPGTSRTRGVGQKQQAHQFIAAPTAARRPRRRPAVRTAPPRRGSRSIRRRFRCRPSE